MAKKPELTDAELLSFAFKDVKPLSGRVIKNEKKKKSNKTIETPNKKSYAIASEKKNPPKTNYPKLSPGDMRGWDKNSARRMMRGKMRIDARLDLHGYHQREAYSVLLDFISSSVELKKRCVLVITGKGLHHKKENGLQTGVLRKMVPIWLNEEPNRGQILGFSEAKPFDGGSGALYVMLKRHREGENL